MHVDRRETGAIERRRHLDLAVDALLAQDRDRRPRAASRCTARRCRRAGSNVSAGARPGSPASSRRAYSWSALSGLSRSRCIACVVADHARWRSMRAASSSVSPAARMRIRSSRGRDADRVDRRVPPRASALDHGGALRAAHLHDGARVPRRTASRAGRAAEHRARARVRTARRTPSRTASRRVRRRRCRDRRAAVPSRRSALHRARRTRRGARGRRDRARRCRVARRPAPAPSRRAGACRAEIDQSSSVSPQSRRSNGVSARRASSTGANAVTISDTGAVTALSRRRRATSCASTSSPCRRGWRCRAPGTAPSPRRARVS